MSEVTVTEDQLNQEQVDQTFLCSRCGMCVTACPTYQETGDETMCSRGRVQMLRGLLEGKIELNDNLRDKLYTCLGCNACTANCPSGVDLEEIVNETRAALRDLGVDLPTLQEALRGNLAGDGNPFGEERGDRGAWLPENLRKPHKSENCIHAGCAISYASSKTGKLILRILDKTGVDYTFMGDEEECCGDPLIRIGERELAEQLQGRNRARLHHYGVKRVITPCAGCLKTLRRDYDEFESFHIVEWVANLIEEGKIKPAKPIEKRIIYFDGCDMGRHAGVYDPPREILKSIPGIELVEYDKNRNFAQCCGGPLMSNDPDMAQSIASKRIEEAAAKEADLIATACPTCFINLKGGAKQAGQRMDIQDVMALLYKSLK